jgi:hypothetical protein
VSRLADAPAAQARRRALRFGGVEGNELLTSSVAALLTILLVAEGVTIIHLDGLLSTHMFIGLALIPPVLLKLASTGYRFMRYYTGSPAYRANGPPLMLLRVLAPILVASTAMIFVTGVWRLLLGHRSDEVLMLHKVGFIVWGGAFGVHFLAHLPQAGRSLGAAWGSSARRRRVAGSRLGATVVAISLGAGIALALALLSHIADLRRAPTDARDANIGLDAHAHFLLVAIGNGLASPSACGRSSTVCDSGGARRLRRAVRLRTTVRRADVSRRARLRPGAPAARGPR